jgi:hypothetical protein
MARPIGKGFYSNYRDREVKVRKLFLSVYSGIVLNAQEQERGSLFARLSR